MKGPALFWLLFGVMLIIDQASKALTRASFAEHEALAIWPGVFELTLTYNKGIAFGKLQGFGVYLAPVALIIAGYAVWYVTKHRNESRWIHGAFGLLASGAIGNLIDRVWLGKVTDMFWFRLIDFPVFNVADACISVAAGILFVKWGLEAVKPTGVRASD